MKFMRLILRATNTNWVAFNDQLSAASKYDFQGNKADSRMLIADS